VTGYTLILSLFNVGPRAVLPCHVFKIANFILDVNNGPPDLTNPAGSFAHSWKSNEMNTSDRQEELWLRLESIEFCVKIPALRSCNYRNSLTLLSIVDQNEHCREIIG